MHLFRRAEGAIEAYREACAALPSISANAGTISPYFRALRQFELCIAQAYQCCLVVQKIIGKELFIVGDHSPMDRLRALYNTSKHADEKIERGKLAKAGNLPIWLTTDGLQSAAVNLSYEEFAAILTNLSGFCCRALEVIDNAAGDKVSGAHDSRSGLQMEAWGSVIRIRLE